MTDPSNVPPDNAATETVDLPLRGLAGAAADTAARELLTLRGVLDAEVVLGAFRLRVTYDPARVEVDAIRERLHALAPPDLAHGDGPPG